MENSPTMNNGPQGMNPMPGQQQGMHMPSMGGPHTHPTMAQQQHMQHMVSDRFFYWTVIFYDYWNGLIYWSDIFFFVQMKWEHMVNVRYKKIVFSWLFNFKINTKRLFRSFFFGYKKNSYVSGWRFFNKCRFPIPINLPETFDQIFIILIHEAVENPCLCSFNF